MLLKARADKNARDSSGQIPLHAAAARGAPLAIDVIVNLKGDNIDVRDNKGRTPLHLAASSGKPKTVRCLLELGADAGARTEGGEFPANLAEGNENVRKDHVFWELNDARFRRLDELVAMPGRQILDRKPKIDS